jgi:CheY-like chemotaxis protein
MRSRMRTILIVEDDAVLADVLATAFGREWKVTVVGRAHDALDAFHAAPTDIVLTDKNMPGMTGIELCRDLRRMDPAVGIVVMTAFGTVDSARESIDFGVDAYIEKPFPDVHQLVREIGRLRERVIARKKRQAALVQLPLHLGVACPDLLRRNKLRSFFGRADRLGWCDSVEDLGAAVRDGHCTATVIDCASFDGEPERLIPLAEPQRAPCMIIAEGLSVPEIAHLIDLGVRALVDRRIDDFRFADMIARGLERLRSGAI